MKFENESLAEVVTLAKNKGYKVFAHQADVPISYVFIEGNGTVGYCQAHFGGIQFSTKHKVCRGAGIGTGYGYGAECHTVQEIDLCLAFAPDWVGAKDRAFTKKYSSFEEYQKQNTILTYFEI